MKITKYISLILFLTFISLSCNSQNTTKVKRANNIFYQKGEIDSIKTLFISIVKNKADNIDNFYKREKEKQKYEKKIIKTERDIRNLEKELEQLKQIKNEQLNKKKKLNNEYKIYYNDYEKTVEELQEKFDGISGELPFVYKQKSYFAFIADPKIHKIEIYLKDYSKKSYPNFSTIGNLKRYLTHNGKKVLMITNGGMFTPEFTPEGLLIFKGKQVYSLDKGIKPNTNFYMKPNGVFYIDKVGNGHIKTTTEFNKIYPKQVQPQFATQSGPMLVINGKIHPKFNHGSPNKYVRSGVGILPNGKIIFIISNNSQSNLFDFAVIFKDTFSCKNALFLDGAISKMYLKNLKPKELGGNFGPLISITKK